MQINWKIVSRSDVKRREMEEFNKKESHDKKKLNRKSK